MAVMQTIMLVGVAPRGSVVERLFRAGFFVLSANDVTAALAMLNALRVDGFVIDVDDPAAGGELLLKRLRESPAWRELPVVITRATPDQCERLAQHAFRGAIITARKFNADAILAALRPLLLSKAATPIDDVPGRHAWADAEVDVPTDTIGRWIAADGTRQYR
jgi:DNA-binding response OmpR family regulator